MIRLVVLLFIAMSYYLGPVLVPDSPNVPNVVFPLKAQLGSKATWEPQMAVHVFGDADAKIEQKYYLGPGKRTFVVNLQPMSPTRRNALVQFWNELGGVQQSFYFDAPNADRTTTRYNVVFDPAQALAWTQASDLIANASVTLVVLPNDGYEFENYPISETLTRFPDTALQSALLSQVQEIIPLLTITPKVWSNSQSSVGFGTQNNVIWNTTLTTSTTLYLGNPSNPQGGAIAIASGGASGSATVSAERWLPGNLYVLTDNQTGRVLASSVTGQNLVVPISDRLCVIGGATYYPRLLGHGGISQQLGPADDATFQLGNADGAFTRLKGLVNLNRADVQFSLFHVGTKTLVKFWRGEVKSYVADEGPTFQLQCSDSVYELNLAFPSRTITRDCYKRFDDGNKCPYALRSTNHGGYPKSCDHGFDTVNGCQAHGMDAYFGGIIANPQGVVIRDNGSSGRPKITATSIVSDTMYGKPLPRVYVGGGLEMPVNAIIAAGRDESDFYQALGIVSEGPIGSFGAPQNQLLDGQTQNYPYTPGENLGGDPNGIPFSLVSGGAYQYPYKAAGVARINITRADTKGIQPSSPDQHTMTASVTQGMQGLIWTAPGQNHIGTLTNPIWVAVDALLCAKGLGPGADGALQEAQFDVASAVAAAAICDLQVPTLVYNRNPVLLPVDGANMGSNQWTSFNPTTAQLPTETQYQFIGIIGQSQPLRDWLDQILINCLGYWYSVNGKIFFGIRENASAVEAFTTGNMLFKSYTETPKAPTFDDITASFADRDFQFSQNSARYFDENYAVSMGGGSGLYPRYEKATINLPGTVTASQAIRVIATRGREELGGVNEFEWKNAVTNTWKTTILALNSTCGQVVSVSHPVVSGGYGKFRIQRFTLNPDYSVQITAQSVTDSMYDLDYGPKPQDVAVPWLPVVAGTQTSNLQSWMPTTFRRGATPQIGAPGTSTFGMNVRYTTGTDGTLQISLQANGSAPVTQYFTSTRPTVQSLVAAAGGSLASGTWHFAVCGLDANGNFSAPSAISRCILAAGQGQFYVNNVVYPAGSVGYVLFLSQRAETLTAWISKPTGLNSGDANFLVAIGQNGDTHGVPPDEWSNVRVTLKAKKVIRHGIVRSVVAGLNPAFPSVILVEPGVIQSNEQYDGLILSLIGDPNGGNLPVADYLIISTQASTHAIGLQPLNGAAMPTVGQIVVIREKTDWSTPNSIGSSYWAQSVDYPNGGIPINADVGQLIMIIGGTGVGQVRQIQSNVPTVHYVSVPWDIQPDGSSIYIVVGSEYLWESSSPVITNNKPVVDVLVPMTIPGLDASTSGIVIIGVLTSNGYESEEQFAPFREIALLTQTDLDPTAAPLQGSWWNGALAYQFLGWIECTPMQFTGIQTVTISWQGFIDGGTDIRKGGVVVGASSGSSGSAQVLVAPGDLIVLFLTANNGPLAQLQVGYPTYQIGGGPEEKNPDATSADSVVNYGNYELYLPNAYPGLRPPPSAVWARYFYARWTGTIYAPVDGLYTFGVNSDDGANLSVNGRQLVNRLGISQPANANLEYTQSGQLYLSGGRTYPIVLEFAQLGGAWLLQLLWTPPGGSTALVVFTPDATLPSSTVLNSQGSIVPNSSIQVSVIAKSSNGNGSWNFVIGWAGGYAKRADQSSIGIQAGTLTFQNLTTVGAYVYAYFSSADASIHVSSGDTSTPPSLPSQEFALACYYDGRVPIDPIYVPAPGTSGGSTGSETGTLSATPGAIASGSSGTVTLNWSSTNVVGPLKIYMGSPSGTLVTNAAGSGSYSQSNVSANTTFYLVDEGDGVVIASFTVAEIGEGPGGEYGGGSQGGPGTCPEENCFVYVKDRGVIPAKDVAAFDWIRGRELTTGETVYRQVKQTGRQFSSTWYEVAGQRVSPHDEIRLAGQTWQMPYRIGTLNTEAGYRIQIVIDAPTYDDRNYELVDEQGQAVLLMHNVSIGS